jgi:hypothetical protein
MREESRSVRAAALAFCVAVMPLVSAGASVVKDWNAIATTVIVTNAGKPPAASVVDLVYVNVAMYDSVNAIDRRYTVFAVSPTSATAGASEDAAAVAAAYNILKTFYPSQQSYLDARYADSLAAIPDGYPKSQGILIGQEVASLFLAQRSGDGRNAPITYTPGSGPGAWQPTPPAFAPAQTPWVAQMRPFAMTSASQFRAAAPPSLGSDTWADDYNETKSLGAIDSVTRTPGETEIGLFYTEHTGAQYNRILRNFAAEQNFSLPDEARFMAQMYVSAGDAIIAVFDSKYHYGRWRPVTAIRVGDTDGNPETDRDPNWTPLAVTPGHPEYPAAHGAFTGALAEGLRRFFGTKDVTITLSSTVTGTSRTFHKTDDLVSEIIVARIYGGMHFRTSCVRGKVQGEKVAKWVAKHHFRPVEDNEQEGDD